MSKHFGIIIKEYQDTQQKARYGRTVISNEFL